MPSIITSMTSAERSSVRCELIGSWVSVPLSKPHLRGYLSDAAKPVGRGDLEQRSPSSTFNRWPAEGSWKLRAAHTSGRAFISPH